MNQSTSHELQSSKTETVLKYHAFLLSQILRPTNIDFIKSLALYTSIDPNLKKSVFGGKQNEENDFMVNRDDQKEPQEDARERLQSVPQPAVVRKFGSEGKQRVRRPTIILNVSTVLRVSQQRSEFSDSYKFQQKMHHQTEI